MRLLLDTHALLWFLDGNSRLSEVARDAISGVTNHRFVSTASLWEIAIKTSVDKLKLASPFEDVIESRLDSNDINVLPIDRKHLIATASLAFRTTGHRDPFD